MRCAQRYHQTKLANACFTAALAEKLSTTAGGSSTVKALCVAPGLAQTNLQATTSTTGGMDGMMWIMHFAQSAEDGAMPLLTACFAADVSNGDFYEPKGGFRGIPARVPFDKHAGSAEQQKMLWEASEEACGKFSV